MNLRKAIKSRRNWAAAFIWAVNSMVPPAIAQGFGRFEDDPTIKDYFYQLLRSPFGTLLMVFCGLGGFAMLYMQREGRAGEKIPLAAIALLVGAVVLFVLRVMITSGVMGAQYLDWNN